MNVDLLVLAVIAGAANWALRVLPVRMHRSGLPQTGMIARFLAATGPAAITTLFVVSILPALSAVPLEMIGLAVGIGAVVAVFLASRSMVAATLGGSVVYGLSVLVLG